MAVTLEAPVLGEGAPTDSFQPRYPVATAHVSQGSVPFLLSHPYIQEPLRADSPRPLCLHFPLPMYPCFKNVPKNSHEQVQQDGELQHPVEQPHLLALGNHELCCLVVEQRQQEPLPGRLAHASSSLRPPPPPPPAAPQPTEHSVCAAAVPERAAPKGMSWRADAQTRARAQGGQEDPAAAENLTAASAQPGMRPPPLTR